MASFKVIGLHLAGITLFYKESAMFVPFIPEWYYVTVIPGIADVMKDFRDICADL